MPRIPLVLHPDRLFPADPSTRDVARRLYATVKDLPIVSPHGHTDPQWFADDQPFADPTSLLITPDHYLTRMLYSQGVRLEELGIVRRDGGAVRAGCTQDWRTFADHCSSVPRNAVAPLARPRASRGVRRARPVVAASPQTACYDRITPASRNRHTVPARCSTASRIEVITTTDSPLDDLEHHREDPPTEWNGRVLTDVSSRFGRRSRPRRLPRPTSSSSVHSPARSAAGTNTSGRSRSPRHLKREQPSTDHGHPTAHTADLAEAECHRCSTAPSPAATRRRKRKRSAARC